MKRKRYSDKQISFALRQAESGTPVEEICRRMGISEPTFYRWKKKFAGMGVAKIRRLKQLEARAETVAPVAPRKSRARKKNLKQLVADLTLDKSMLQDVLRRKW